MKWRARLKGLLRRIPKNPNEIRPAPNPSEAAAWYTHREGLTNDERRAEIEAEIGVLTGRLAPGDELYSLLGHYRRRRNGELVALSGPAWDSLLGPEDDGEDVEWASSPGN